MVSYREFLRFVWQFIREQKGAFFFIFLLTALALPLDNLIWPYILHLVVDVFVQFDGNRLAAWQALKIPILGAIGLTVYVEVLSRTMGFLMAKALPKLQASLRLHMFDHIQLHSPRYFNEKFAGSLANQITDMTTQVETILIEMWWPIIPAAATCLFGAVVLYFISPLFMWIFLAWFIVHIVISVRCAKSCDFYQHRHGEVRSTLLGKVVDSLTNNYAVNLFYRFAQEKASLAAFQKKEEKANATARKYVERMRLFLSFGYCSGAIFGLNGAILYLWMADQITTGQAVQVFNTVWSLTVLLWTASNSFPVLFQAFGTAKQAYTVMRDPPDVVDAKGAQDLKVAKGEIEFRNVSFQYGEKQLFKNKHVHIRGGERVGLVGFSGAGKSTFVNLILRFFPLESGQIFIDGQEISSVTLKSLRSQIALIPQDPILFHRTLKENIAYGKPDASDAEILEAAKLSHCDAFIRNIPDGYDAKVGERGTKLSGGEKQRIAIARALLMNAPILILDEATSALDSVTEKFIQDNLAKLMQNRTSIVIAHRLSTLSHMDRILVFDQGKIVEEGSHAALLKAGGLYAKMWNKQVGGFLPDAPVS